MPSLRASQTRRDGTCDSTKETEHMNTPVFSWTSIVLTSVITAGAAFLVWLLLRTRWRLGFLVDGVLVAVVAGLSVLVWRSVGNTGSLNNDPIPGVSPNDVLCPLVTYLFVGFYAAFRRPADAARFEQLRVLLTLVSLVVNIVTI